MDIQSRRILARLSKLVSPAGDSQPQFEHRLVGNKIPGTHRATEPAVGPGENGRVPLYSFLWRL